MPDMHLEWSPPPSLIEALSSGKEALAAIEETKSTYAHFLTQTGVAPAQANEAADALVTRIITALARGDSPESAVVWAKQGIGISVDPLVGNEAPPLQTLAEALSQGRADAMDVIAKAVATAGSSPEAQKAAIGTLLTSLANGNELAVAQQQAITAGQTTDSLKADNAVPLNATDTLISNLAQGGPGVGDALHGLAAGAGAEQGAALVQNLLAALSNGTSSEAAAQAWQEQASAQTQMAQAQTVPVSSVDAMIAALSSGADVREALMSAGFGGDSAASQALAQALAGGAGSAAAAAAAQQASQAQAAAEALITAGVAAPSALLAGLASGGADAGSAIAAASRESDSGAFIGALTQALSTGASTEAALQAANTASSAAETQVANAASPSSAETALAAALASGADVQSALASVGLSSGGSQGDVMTSALTQALSSGHDLASAVGSATTAGAASNQQVAAAQEGVPAPDPQLMAMSSGPEQGSSASTSETATSGNGDSAPATGQPETTVPSATSTDPGAQVAEATPSTTASDSPPTSGQTEASSTASSLASGNTPADASPSPPEAEAAQSTPSVPSDTNNASTNSFDVASETQTITAPFAPENHSTSTSEVQTTQSPSGPSSPETSTSPVETQGPSSSADTSTTPVDTENSGSTANTQTSSTDTSTGSSGGSSGPVTNSDTIDMTNAFSAAAFAGAAANNLSGDNPTALEFDLSSQPSFSNGMTVEAWINQAKTVPGPIAVVVDDQSTDTSGNPLNGFKIEITHSNNIEIEVANGIVDGHYTDTEVTTTDTPIVNGAWENIAATYSNTGAVSISVNGVVDTNVTTGTYQDSPVPASGAITNAPSSVIIGTERDPNSDSNWSAARDFAGMISDVQIWNSSSQNIQTDMSHQLSTAASAAASESNLVLAAPLNSSTFTGITQGGTSNVTVADLTNDNEAVTSALQSGASVPTIASTAQVPNSEPTTSTSASVYQALVLGTSSTNSAISIDQPTYSTTYTPQSDPSTPTTVTGTADSTTNPVYQTPALPTAAQASTPVTVTATITATDTTGASDEATQVVHATAT